MQIVDIDVSLSDAIAPCRSSGADLIISSDISITTHYLACCLGTCACLINTGFFVVRSDSK
jgi:hypothetical protein